MVLYFTWADDLISLKHDIGSFLISTNIAEKILITDAFEKARTHPNPI